MMAQAGVRSDRPEGERSRYAYAPCQFRSEADRTDTGDRVESISTTADDVQAIVKMQNLAEISAGDCVALPREFVTSVSGQRSPMASMCDWRRCPSSQRCCPKRETGCVV